MKKNFFILILCLVSIHSACQQPVGSWSDHLNYSRAYCIAMAPAGVYASAGEGLLVYSREFSELKKMSPVNGLSETSIRSIAWSSENNTLVIAYESTGIDLVRENSVCNIPDILNKYIPGKKSINRIRTSGKYAYLATTFGIVVVDLAKMEIHDTWKPGSDANPNEVFDVAAGNGKIYAATASGVWQADESNPGLAWFGNWSLFQGVPAPNSGCSLILPIGDKLYMNFPDPSSGGDRIYVAGTTTTLFSFMPGIYNRSFDAAPGGFTVTSPGELRYYTTDGTLSRTISSYPWGAADMSQGLIENGTAWIADRNWGLVRADNFTDFTSLVPDGPASDTAASISAGPGKIFICAGGTDDHWNGIGSPLRVSVYENGRFGNITLSSFRNAMRACSDPGSDHFFVTSWGDGLFEFSGNKLINHYDNTNSPLIGSGPGGNEIKTFGLAFDRTGNLWITHTGGTQNILILKPDGSWVAYPATVEAPVIGDIITTGSGQKWILLPGGNGLFVIDDNNTPYVFSDDRTRRLTIRDTDGNIISESFSLAEDLDGNIWVGTDQGPVIYSNTGRIFSEDPRCSRIKVPRNDGSGLADYMLGTETITSIAVDGANRKWLGTAGSGAYLLSADGTGLVRNYNEMNSPLFSDSIRSISVDGQSGEVWIGTRRGILSVRELATAGSDAYVSVYSFPNPVRENFTGNVTITGLMRDTEIKITDVSGNLVFKTMSEGGQASWDLTTYTGHRVTTGVYLVFCSNSDGSRTYVTKILVIGR